MRLWTGDRAIDEVDVYLTVDEARRAVEVLGRLIDEVTQMGFPESHGGLADGRLDLTLFVSKDAAEQATGFDDRVDS